MNYNNDTAKTKEKKNPYSNKAMNYRYEHVLEFSLPSILQKILNSLFTRASKRNQIKRIHHKKL